MNASLSMVLILTEGKRRLSTELRALTDRERSPACSAPVIEGPTGDQRYFMALAGVTHEDARTAADRPGQD